MFVHREMSAVPCMFFTGDTGILESSRFQTVPSGNLRCLGPLPDIYEYVLL